MKAINGGILIILISLSNQQNLEAQGFVNLNFESANLTGYSSLQQVPISSALPGWSVDFIASGSTNAVTQVVYNGISLGGQGISIIDSNAPSFLPLQGKYSAFLFGTDLNGSTTAMISQTALVPNDAASLLLDVYAFNSFEVSLGGQTINMIPLETFSNYTLYGANISSFAGDVETFSLIAPPTGGPNGVEFDNIQFSTSAVPEPSIFGFFALGGAAFAWRRCQKS